MGTYNQALLPNLEFVSIAPALRHLFGRNEITDSLCRVIRKQPDVE